jgi:hypothetical protein
MQARKRYAAAALLVVAAAGVTAGCSGPAAGTPGPVARLERIGHSPEFSVVLTPTGARRIGIQTTTVTAVKAGRILIPSAALLYVSDGRTAVYVNTAPLVYTRRFVSVDTIAGDRVYIGQGLTPGMKVVTAGAEELLGVQNGVGAKT